MMSDTNPNKLRGSRDEKVSAINALDRRRARRANRGNGETADWQSANPEFLQGLIAIVTGERGTITLGYTKNGSSYYVSYYFGKESEAVYCRPSEGIDEFLEGEIESFK